MRTPQELAPLIPTLRAIQRLLDQFDNQGMIIGGVAVSLLGRPRLTVDVDAVVHVSVDDLSDLIQAARKVGFEPRTSDVEQFARRNRVVLLRHPKTNVEVDISLSALPFEAEAIERSRLVNLGKLHLRLPTVEDLIILKAVAHRPKDLLDIQTLVEIHPNLDRERIEHWVRQFAELMEMPELWTDTAALLKK